MVVLTMVKIYFILPMYKTDLLVYINLVLSECILYSTRLWVNIARV